MHLNCTKSQQCTSSDHQQHSCQVVLHCVPLFSALLSLPLRACVCMRACVRAVAYSAVIPTTHYGRARHPLACHEKQN